MYNLEKLEKEISVDEYLSEYVNVEEFLECCKVCPNYESVWSCPPFDFNPIDYWKKYKTLHVWGYKINFEGEVSQERSYEIMAEVKQKVTEELFEMEKEFEGSVSLSAGSCSLCGKGNCTKPLNQPCRHKDKMRYSVEALGGNVGKTVSKLLGVELEWIEEGKVPSHFVLVGGLLRK